MGQMITNHKKLRVGMNCKLRFLQYYQMSMMINVCLWTVTSCVGWVNDYNYSLIEFEWGQKLN